MQLSRFGLLFSNFLLLTIISCSPPKKDLNELNRQADVSFLEHISSYTQGVVSSREIITLRLAERLTEEVRNSEAVNSILNFTPSIKGKGRWVSNLTMEFIPNEPLKAGQEYLASLDLSRLKAVDEAHTIFEFGFEVMNQNYDLLIDGLLADESDPMHKQLIKGSFVTADVADSAEIVNAIEFIQAGENLEVSWQIDQVAGTNHEFIVEGIERFEEPGMVLFEVNGSKLNVDEKRNGSIKIPELGNFRVIESKVVKAPSPHLIVSFSDPILENQDLEGIILLEGERDLKFDISNNEVKIYTASGVTGEKLLKVHTGLKNSLGYGMKTSYTGSVNFEPLKPAVRLINQGTILPSTDGLLFPFEAVNLKAVDISVVRIFEQNIQQFLQVNRLNGQAQIRRVGKPIVEKALRLDDSGITQLASWNRFTIDLAEIIETEPGAIYQVILSFKKQYSLYDCGSQEVQEPELELSQDNWDEYAFEDDGNYGSYVDNNYPYNYSWQDRENPCTNSYYFRKSVRRNVLASDLGLIAKIGNNRKLTAFVTDLLTTNPLSNVNVEVYDFQNQLLEILVSDQEGKVELDLVRKPFLMIAKNGDQHGYLKLDDGTSLSLSNFNVSGAEVKRGIKGFIYAERGVWRPGDNIYFNFVLEDKDQNLPDDHPVVFELIDPSGNTKKRIVRNGALNDFYNFSTKTEQSAPTGNWLAKVSVGGNEFTKRVKIETVKPNRLKINLDFGLDKITPTNNQLNGALNVQWLTGVPARNLNTEFELSLNAVKTTFSEYPNYSFDDKSKRLDGTRQVIYQNKVDQNGDANFNVKINSQPEAPGKLLATFHGKVFEAGGDFSIDQFSIPYFPYTHFVGIKMPEGDNRGQLITGKDHQIGIVTLDVEEKLASRNQLKVEVYKLDWRWWWDRSNDNLSSYVGRTYNKPIMSKQVRTTNGKATVNVNIDDNQWGRYFVRVMDLKSGHSAGTVAYFDWPGWASDDNRPGGASLLSFTTDKEAYQVNENVFLNIPSSQGSRALVSIENGSKVISTHWVETKSEQTEFSFKVTEEMVPNVYINTTLIQPHAQTENDLPIRLYGVVPVSVENPDTRLYPELQLADVLEPESEVQVTVSESQGKPMTYTIAVVDEGLLDITRFKTPNPWASFYAREALGVKTWDLFDDVTVALNGEMERLLALGGDGTGVKPAKAKANRFKPVVKFMGPFELKPGQSRTHSYEMPNYVGSVRTMVVAGQNGAYGIAEQATPVRKPLMVLGTLPRVIGPGETVKLPVNVFALDPTIKDVKVTLKTNDLIKIKGGGVGELNFSQIGDQVIDFELQVAENIGIGKVDILVESGREKASYEVEIDVRNPNPEQTEVISAVIQAGETWKQSFEALGMNGTNATQLELSVMPPINLGKRLKYLMQYPHGCIEQTTSAAFPQLFVTDILDMNDKRSETN